MSPPSFPSFPPSFASFPELDPGPSKRSKPESKGDKVHGLRFDKSRESNKRKEKKRKHKDNLADVHAHPSDDERVKANEDATFNDVDLTRPFYSDRKGDPLNIRYEGLYAGDVPKYRPVNRMRLYTIICDV